MILRPRQEEFVSKCLAALGEKGNTLAIASTGFGKTVALSSVISNFGSSLVLQHRDVLVEQNRRTFKRISRAPSDLFVANRKRFVRNGHTFAMVQTLVRNLEKMAPVEIIATDEAHHAAAKSYRLIYERAQELNPAVKMFGVTATPERGDGKALREIYNNVADVVTLTELIQAGLLVRPRTFVIDCGLRDELRKVRVTASDFDMGEVEKIMDKMAVNDRIFDEWKRLAGDRRTVAFCSTVEHARHVVETFKNGGISAELVHGGMPESECEAIKKRLESGETQFVANVAKWTEGFDVQPIGCVILIRPCSHKSTVIQMIGRGLRTVDPERFPGVIKDDCVVLDFGYSLLTHGDINADPTLGEDKKDPKPRTCPQCEAVIPPRVYECPLCGAEIEKEERNLVAPQNREALTDFKMLEVELLEISPFRWEEVWDNLVFLANGLTAWAACINLRGRWVSVGAEDKGPVHVLSNNAERFVSLAAADDFLRTKGDKSNARKSKSWLSLPASEKQLQTLGLNPFSGFGVNRYRASCLLTWRFNERNIRAALAA